MNQDEVESQLSAMFDGELPAAECELLSRRIDRDDKLRARWSRYASIGAAMRCEPVATARGDFAARVSRAVNRASEGRSGALRGRSRYVWQCALAAGLVGAVAGLSLVMLRDVALQPASPALRQAAVGVPVLHSPAYSAAHPAVVALRSSGPAVAPAGAPAGARHEPYSYVTPANDAADPSGLRTELVDYIVAHSQYSTPLMQPDLLSSLISGEDTADDGVHALDAAGAPAGTAGASPPMASSAAAAAAPASAAADDANAPTAAPAASR